MTTQTLSWRDVLATSHRALDAVVAGIRDDQWTLPTPCVKWNVTQVLQHAAGDQLAYAAALGVGSGPDYDPFAPSGTVEGNPVTLVRNAIERTAAAFDALADTTRTAPTPLPQGELPIEIASGACALDAAVHAWDIAVATGQPSPLTEQLSARLFDTARAIVEPLRQYGAFAPALDALPSDSIETKLLRYLGR